MTAQIAAYGRLARDPRQHETTSGKPMTTGTIAVEVELHERGAETAAETLWLQVCAFGRQADDLARMAKGEPVSVAGRLQMTRYQTREGDARESWQCIADSVVSARTVRPKGGGRRSGGNGARERGNPRPGGERNGGTRDRTADYWPASGPGGPRDPDPPRRTDGDLPFDDPLPF